MKYFLISILFTTFSFTQEKFEYFSSKNIDLGYHYFLTPNSNLSDSNEFILFDFTSFISKRFLLDDDNSIFYLVSNFFLVKRNYEYLGYLIQFMNSLKNYNFKPYHIYMSIYLADNFNHKGNVEKPTLEKYKKMILNEASYKSYKESKFFEIKNQTSKYQDIEMYMLHSADTKNLKKLYDETYFVSDLVKSFSQANCVIASNLKESIFYKSAKSEFYLSRFAKIPVERYYWKKESISQIFVLINDHNIEVCILGNCADDQEFYYFISSQKKFSIVGNFVVSEQKKVPLLIQIEVEEVLFDPNLFDSD